jgi:hypothetical protein
MGIFYHLYSMIREFPARSLFKGLFYQIRHRDVGLAMTPALLIEASEDKAWLPCCEPFTLFKRIQRTGWIRICKFSSPPWWPYSWKPPPFLLLGAFLSAVLEVYLNEAIIYKYLPKRKLTGLCFGLLAGMVIPTCECGVVPIVRRFLQKDIPPHVAMTYMFAAPVFNPLVLAATYVAFQGNIWMVLGRAGIVAICASCMGWALSYVDSALQLRQNTMERLLEPNPSGSAHLPALETAFSPHIDVHDCHGHCEGHSVSPVTQVVLHTAAEFMDMGNFLILE